MYHYSNILSEDENKAIVQVPVSSMGVRDRLLFWTQTKNGHYTVASRYKMALNNLGRQRAGGEGSSKGHDGEEKRMWNKVWKLNIKKKIKNFIWKACHDRIPTTANLKKRGIGVDDQCNLCGEGVETTEHFFFSSVAQHA